MQVLEKNKGDFLKNNLGAEKVFLSMTQNSELIN